MSFEPQKFFIGLIDFFAIILPGALLTFLVKDSLGTYVLGWHYGQLTGTSAWVVFLAASYLLGHFVFLIGSWLLDDFAYDPMRNASYGKQITKLAEGERPSPLLLRWFSRIFFGKETDLTVRYAVKIKEHYLGPLEASNAVNAFQWSKAKLTLAYPAAIESVHRFEADSKFFRSLVILCIIVLGVLAPFGIVEMRRELATVCVPVLILAFWRYVDQRLKATHQSYWYVLALESKLDSTLRQPPSPLNPNAPTHAGGIVFRRKEDTVQFLLVQTKDPDNKAWVLPKGHIEPAEKMTETAVREVREEAGVWAKYIARLDDVTLPLKGKPIDVQFYLMEKADLWIDDVVSEIAFILRRLIWWEEPDRRKRTWVPLQKAKSLLIHPETEKMLELANDNVPAVSHKR
jgi:8-oxo-dGTP pyrophosphatase MutT (NUDIX family)